MALKFKDYAVELSSDGDGGTIKGLASTFHREPDCYGDVVAKGAFAESLAKWAESGNPIPLLFGHRMDDPAMNIGAVKTAAETDEGLEFEAEFDADNETAQYCRKLAKEGRLTKFSFAFDVLESGETTLDNGVKANELRKLDIFEISLVTVPANQHAELIDVKTAPVYGEKAGRVLSKSNEDDLRQAVELIQGVLDRLDPDDGDDDGDGEAKATPKAGTDARGTAIIDRINEIIER